MREAHVEVADFVDELVDALDKEQLADEYEAGASSPVRAVLQQWRLFVAHVVLLDEAIHAPLCEGAAVVLLTATALHRDEAFELTSAMAHIGKAVTWEREAVRLCAEAGDGSNKLGE
ncbi:MAG: hypothetical protein JWM95_4253 [Gemmatimonadetes bacterium]|nr:hypothetical protein [Gemmatimonadota bacterium]